MSKCKVKSILTNLSDLRRVKILTRTNVVIGIYVTMKGYCPLRLKGYTLYMSYLRSKTIFMSFRISDKNIGLNIVAGVVGEEEGDL